MLLFKNERKKGRMKEWRKSRKKKGGREKKESKQVTVRGLGYE